MCLRTITDCLVWTCTTDLMHIHHNIEERLFLKTLMQQGDSEQTSFQIGRLLNTFISLFLSFSLVSVCLSQAFALTRLMSRLTAYVRNLSRQILLTAEQIVFVSPKVHSRASYKTLLLAC